MPSRANRLKTIRRKSTDQIRGSSHARGYDRKWQEARELKLKQNPVCEDCEENGEVTEAVEVHHIQKIKDRPELRLILTNLKSLCKRCHSIRTQRGE